MSAKSFSNLPTELLHKIFTYPSMNFDHLLSCALVCVSWQYAARLLYLLYPGLKSDFLLILLPPENQTGRQCCRIYNYCSLKIHRIFLPQLQGGWYTAFSHGWLLTVANQAIHLLNPITRATVKLPPEKRFRKPEIVRMSSKKPEFTRVITSNIPTDPLCKVLVIHPGKHGHSFSFCRTGDHAWIRINNFVGRCSDAIFYKGDVYAIDFYGYIWFIQPNVCNFEKAVKLSVEPVRDPEISSLIAAKMREFNSLEMPGPKDVLLWQRLSAWLGLAKKLYSAEDPKEFQLDALEEEIRLLEKELPCDHQEIGFCHNDLQYGNIMMDEETRAITLIDYEYASYNPVAFDIANKN